MVIHGFNEKSRVMAERPEIFIHDEEGNIVRHPAWKSMSTDWASPAYHAYMADLVRHDVKEYGIDGYRVDAASYKGASWDPKSPSPAYVSGSASPALMRMMIEELRKANPEAVLLSEVFGPVFYMPSNLVHDNQTEAVQMLVEKMDRGEATAADYKAHMANVFDLLPPGANRVFFARNHDTSWFYHFNGYTPRLLAMDAIHALCAIPEVFAGDPKNGPHPDDDPAVYAYYRKLFALRKSYPELARGELLLREVDCDRPTVFTALRRLGRDVAIAVVSLSDKPETAKITLAPTVRTSLGAENVTLQDPMTGITVSPSFLAGKTISVTLRPFQVLVGRI